MKSLIAALLALGAVAAHAVTPGRILSDLEATGADPAALASELEVFEAIRQGIVISLAVCEGQPDCTPAVSDLEIDRLIQVLNARIEHLSGLQGSEEAAADYSDLLDEYQEEREKYALFRQELQDIGRPIEEVGTAAEEAPEAPSAEKAAAGSPEEEIDIELFEDVGEELE
jgi:hypothetical protein